MDSLLLAAMRCFLPELRRRKGKQKLRIRKGKEKLRKALSKEKHRRRKGLTKEIKFLKKEIRSIRAFLRMVGDVTPEELDEETNIWAKDLRQLCYDTEDILDTYLVRVECLQPAADQHRHSYSSSGFVKKLTGAFNKDETCDHVAEAARDVKSAYEELFVRYGRYRVADITCRPALTTVDPRIISLCRKNEDIIGIEEAMEELITRRMTYLDAVSNQQLRIISLVGLAGVGKTTLAMVLYRKLKSQFDSNAFVSVSPNPDIKRVFLGILGDLIGSENVRKLFSWDQTKLIEEIKKLLQDRRYLIILDDIWDRQAWLTIKPAMVDNNLGSIIITTTRKFDVAEEIGGVYGVQPLPLQSSRILFCRRIFGTHESPNKKLDEISENILKKCGGVPLAIDVVSSFLVGKPRERWLEVCNSIMEDKSMETNIMRRILLLSYNNLPSHVRNCLLYLSMFSECNVIRSDQLVWMWIAEGFVEGQQGYSLFEVGNKYLDELLNSSMIQELHSNNGDGMVKNCSLPNMVRALVLYLTAVENFATVLDGWQVQDYSTVKIRRLSFQNCTMELEHATAEVTLEQVRSVIAFDSGIDAMPPLSRFYVLRVLELEGCELNAKCDLKHICDLLQLRYLGLRGTDVAELPKGIGNLRFLQILDLKGTSIKELPSTVALLRRLLCLYVELTTRLPTGMGNLTSLEELSKISVSESTNSLKELASLVELRVLDIALQQDVTKSSQSQKDVLEFLSIVRKMQSLRVYGCSDLDFMKSKEGWSPPPALRRFVAVNGWFSDLPTWISDAEGLSELQIGVRELWREGMQCLGRLRELRFLCLAVERMGERLAVDADAFPKLTQLRLSAHTCLVFRRGAMPKVELVEFVLDVDKADGDFSWGLSNLHSLEKVTVKLHTSNSASANKEAEAAVRHAVDSHPNRRIKLEIITVTSPNKQMESVDDRAGNVASSSEIQEERYAL